MWRMNYTILRNLHRLPKILETMHRMIDRSDLYTEQENYDYVRYIVELMQRTGHVRTECYGEENLPAEGGYILYPNHQGKYDAYSMVAVHPRPMSVVMNREKSYYILINEIIEILNGKRMDTQDVRQASKVIYEIAEEVSQGRRYVIFPEGNYSGKKKNTLWDFKAGSFKAAMKAGVPIVPVALVDSYKVYNSWQLTPVATQVHFLKPIFPEEYQDMKTVQVGATVKERIQNKLDELIS